MIDLNESKSQEIMKSSGDQAQDEVENGETHHSAHNDIESPLLEDITIKPIEITKEATLTAIQPIFERLKQLEEEVTQLTEKMSQLIDRADLLPRQIRQLGTKVDDITESISQSRVRDLLGSFLLLYDLIDQMNRSSEIDTTKTQNYRVLLDQIVQVFQVQGIYPITDAVHFDPTIHKAIDTIPCATPDEDGEIIRIYRTGFRTDQTILRYAEAIVKRYQPPDNPGEVKNP